jgi:signal transduction histidine kinase
MHLSFLRNMRVGYKLNLAMLIVLSITTVVASILVTGATEGLTTETGDQRIDEEITVVLNRFAELENDLMIKTKLLASTSGVVEAIVERDTDRLRTLLLTNSATLELDDIDVVDANGAELITITVESAETYNVEDEERLLSLALLGIETTGTVAQDDANGMLLAASIPLRDRSGTIVGGLLASHLLDDAALAEIDFSRSEVHLAVVHRGELVAQFVEHRAPTEQGEGGDLHGVEVPTDTQGLSLDFGHFLDESAIQQALRGEIVISDELVYTTDGVPHARAYVPLTFGSGDTQTVVAILVNLSRYSGFQRRLTQQIIIALFLLGLATLAMLAVLTRWTISIPLHRLRSVAVQLMTGDYSPRANARSKDEVGQLASAINELADAVQDREQKLQKLAESLEQQVEDRTHELREQAEQLRITSAQAREAARIKSEFLANMSHELRTPLNAIIGFSDILLIGMAGEINDRQQHQLERLRANGKRLLTLVNDILDITRIEAKRIELAHQPFSPHAFIRQLALQMESLAKQKDLDFNVSIDPSMPDMIVGDQKRLEQIAVNLLSNAFKFTETGSVSLESGVDFQAKTWHLTVKDTGIGIPPHALDTIFEEFRQVDGSSRRAYGGSGLGLAIVRHLVRIMDGEVTVESKMREGSTFRVALPLLLPGSASDTISYDEPLLEAKEA